MKRVFLGVVIGLIIACGIGTVAYNYNARDIEYSPSDKNWKVSNVSDAIESLKKSSDQDISSDVSMTISDITTVSMNISISENYNDATYIYIVGNKTKTSSENNIVIDGLEPGTSYKVQAIVKDSDGNLHMGSKTKSTKEGIWLYKDGSIYDLAGDFIIKGYVGSDNYTLTKEDTYMRLNVPNNKRATFMRENNIIDFSNYNKVYVLVNNSNANLLSVFLSTRENYNGYDTSSGDLGYNYNKEESGEHLVTFDISSLTSSGYVYVRKTHAGYVDVKRIWFE